MMEGFHAIMIGPSLVDALREPISDAEMAATDAPFPLESTLASIWGHMDVAIRGAPDYSVITCTVGTFGGFQWVESFDDGSPVYYTGDVSWTE